MTLPSRLEFHKDFSSYLLGVLLLWTRGEISGFTLHIGPFSLLCEWDV